MIIDTFREKLSIFHLCGYLNEYGLWEHNKNFEGYFYVTHPSIKGLIRVAEGANHILIDSKLEELNDKQYKWLKDKCDREKYNINKDVYCITHI